MGMFDNISCEYPCESYNPNVEYQTKFRPHGCRSLSLFTINADGTLTETVHTDVPVPPEERPNWGKPEWNQEDKWQQFLVRYEGSTRRVKTEHVPYIYTGFLNFYPCSDDPELVAYFKDGKLVGEITEHSDSYPLEDPEGIFPPEEVQRDKEYEEHMANPRSIEEILAEIKERAKGEYGEYE